MDNHFTVTPRFATKMLEKALRLYTPSLSEKPMAEFLADKCDDLGFEDIQIDEVGNVIAKKRIRFTKNYVVWSYGCSSRKSES